MPTYTPVTNIDWPSSLPNRPIVSQYQEQFPHTMIESSIDVGPKNRRRRISKNIARFSCTYILDYGQIEILRQFYEETTYGGTLSFNFTHPRTGEPIVARFGTNPIRIDPIGAHQKYKVTISFEQMPWQSQELFIPDANANIQQLDSSKNVVIVWQGPAAWFHEGTYRRIWYIHYTNIGNIQSNWLGYYDLDSDSFSDLLDLQSPNSSGSDNHHMGSVILSDSGHIMFCYDDIDGSHNKGIIIKRSTNPEDRSAFTIVYDGTISGRNLWQAYPTLWKRASDGRIFLIYRGNITSVDEYHDCLVYSDDGGLTWGTEMKIIEAIQGLTLDTPINYYIISNGSRKWVGLEIILRSGASGKMKYVFFIKSNDGITWQNLEGTFSKNIETEGFITSDEAKANCALDLTLDNSNNDYVAANAVACTDDGDFYICWQRLIYNGVSYDYEIQLVTYVNGVKKQYDITSLWEDRGHLSGGHNIVMIAYPGGIVDIFTKITDTVTGADKMIVVRSYDAGETWEDIRQVFDYADNKTVGYLRPTLNTFDAEKALVVFNTKDLSDSLHDAGQLVLRR